MNALIIHDAIQRTRNNPSRDTIDQLLDILTVLNDRVTELEQRLTSTTATARHADESAGRLANGVHHHG